MNTVPHHAPEPAPAGQRSSLRAALREPLLHFLLLGAAVFAADAILAGDDDGQAIVVTAQAQTEARQIFEASMKRPPNPAEMKLLMDRWLDNEILYREGLVLGLDKGDQGIRDRVIFKAMSVTQAGIKLPEIDEKALRSWFESRRERYDQPDRFDFLEAVMPSDTAPEALERFAQALNGQARPEGDSSLRVFRDRPRPNLVQSYGDDFAAALAQATPGKWQLLVGKAGPHVVRLEALKPGAPAEFDAIKVAVYQDWKDEATSRLTKGLIQDMGRKYSVRFEQVK